MGKLVGLSGGSRRLKSRRGIAASVLTLFIVLGSLDNSTSLVAALVLTPVIWWFWWWVAGVGIAIWRGLVEGKPPMIAVGRPWQSSSTRKQLREDANGEVFADRGGILMRERFWFIATGTPPIRIPADWYRTAVVQQEDVPVLIARYRDRLYWWYEGAIYWTNDTAYDREDIKALLFVRERRRERELEHAHNVLRAGASADIRKREPIPKDVRQAVWRRDAGRCVECGTDFDLQYDHIIPLAMGGANTVENLQLLCGRCNQQKGGKL